MKMKMKEGSPAEEAKESTAFENKEDPGRKDDMIPMDKSKKKPNRKRATY